MKILGVTGFSGSGKTTLITAMLPIISAWGYSVSTVKHAHHGFDIDRPGKDSHRHREAGAKEVMIASGTRWALMHESLDEEPPKLDQLLSKLQPVDLVLVEGYKYEDCPMIEVWNPSSGTQPLFPLHRKVVALVCDEDIDPVKLGRTDLAVFTRDEIGLIATFIADFIDGGKLRRSA